MRTIAKTNDIIHDNINEIPGWNWYFYKKYYTIWRYTSDLPGLSEVFLQVIGYVKVGKKEEDILDYLRTIYESRHIAENEISYVFFAFYALLAGKDDIRYTSKEKAYEYIINKGYTYESCAENVKLINESLSKQSTKYKYASNDSNDRNFYFTRKEILDVHGLTDEEYLDNSSKAIQSITDFFLKSHKFISLSAEDKDSEYDWEKSFLESFRKTFNALGYKPNELKEEPVIGLFERYDAYILEQTKKNAKR